MANSKIALNFSKSQKLNALLLNIYIELYCLLVVTKFYFLQVFVILAHIFIYTFLFIGLYDFSTLLIQILIGINI